MASSFSEICSAFKSELQNKILRFESTHLFMASKSDFTVAVVMSSIFVFLLILLLTLVGFTCFWYRCYQLQKVSSNRLIIHAKLYDEEAACENSQASFLRASYSADGLSEKPVSQSFIDEKQGHLNSGARSYSHIAED